MMGPFRLAALNGVALLGFGLPASLAAALVHRRVIAWAASLTPARRAQLLVLWAVALAAGTALIRGVQSAKLASRLLRAPSFELSGGVGVIDSERTFALTVGWLRARVLVSTALFATSRRRSSGSWSPTSAPTPSVATP